MPMLMTPTRPAARPAPVLTEPPVRPERSDRLPRWAVAAAIASLPLLIPPGPGNSAPADVVIFFAIAATLLWAASTRQRLKIPYVAGMTTMIIAGALAAIFGHYPHIAILTLFQDFFLLGWGATLANVARTDAAARFLVRAWGVSGSLWGVGLLAFVGRTAASSGTATAEAARASFTLGEQNGAGFYFVVTLFMILAGRCPRRLLWRVPAIACLVFDTLLTGSLGAISGLIVGLGLALVVHTGARRGGAAALVLAVVLAAAGAGGYELMHRYQVVERAQSSPNLLLRNSIGRAQQSTSERQTLAAESRHLLSTSSLLGIGPAATKSALEHEQAPYPKEAHDDWTATLVERGVLGLIGLLLLVGEIVLRASRVGSPRRLGPGLAAALPAPQFLIGALAVLTIYSFTHEILHDRTAWALLGMLAAFSLWRAQPGRSGHPPSDLVTSGRP